ncbi:MAG: hypothetical protein ACRD6B_03285, partial [Bryobacteraceae bacterium]
MRVDDRQRTSARVGKPSEEGEPPLVAAGVTFKGLTDHVTGIVLRPHVPIFWFVAFLVALAATFMLVGAIGVLLDVGIGTFGSNIPNAWVFPIANYVWWIEIAVGGSLL